MEDDENDGRREGLPVPGMVQYRYLYQYQVRTVQGTPTRYDDRLAAQNLAGVCPARVDNGQLMTCSV
jgi:hypothetical protein